MSTAVTVLKLLHAYDVLLDIADKLDIGYDHLLNDLKGLKDGSLTPEAFVAKHKALRDISTSEL